MFDGGVRGANPDSTRGWRNGEGLARIEHGDGGAVKTIPPSDGSTRAPASGISTRSLGWISAPPPVWMRRLWMPILASVVGFAHLVIALAMTVPIIHGDEAGYLGNAMQMLKGVGRTGEGYFAGYSILLVPAAAVTTSPLAFFTASLVVNAVLAVGAFLLIYRLVRGLLPEAPTAWLALAAFAASMLPAPMMLSAVAMADNALLVVVPLVALGMVLAERRDSSTLWILSSLIAGFAYWTNPRGVLVSAAYVISAAASGWVAHRSMRWIITALVPTTTMMLFGHFFNKAIVGGSSAPGTRPSELADALARVGDVHQWQSILALISGRVSYLVVASAGLALVGFVWLGTGLWRNIRAHTSDGTIGARIFLDLGIASTIVLSSISFTRETFIRADYLIYGRYSEVFLPTLTAIGAVVVLTILSRRSRSRFGVLVVGTAIVAAAAMRYARPPLAPEAWVNWLNVPSLWWIRGFLGHSYLGRMLVLGALVSAALWLVMIYNRLVGTLLVAASFAAASWLVVSGYAIAGSVSRADQTVLAGHVATLESAGVEITCIAVDWPGASFFHVRQYQFLLPQIVFIDATSSASDACNLVVTPRLDLDRDEPGARLVGSENHFPMRLWIRLDMFGSDERRSMDTAGLFFDEVPPTSLQDLSMYRSEVRVVAAAHTDHEIVAELVLRHAGAGSPWLGSFADLGSGGVGRVQLGAALESDSGTVLDEWRVPLPASLLPSEEARINITRLLDPALGKAVLRLRVGLVHEGVTTFGAQGDPPVIIELEP